MLACFMSLRTNMSDMLTVLKYLMYLHAFTLGILFCPIYLTFEKLNFKYSYIEESGFYSETYVEPT